MLRGLPVQRWGMEQTRRALWILGCHLGTGEVQDKAGSLIHDVKDTGVKFEESATVRYFQTNIAIPFHTDGCDAPLSSASRRACLAARADWHPQ